MKKPTLSIFVCAEFLVGTLSGTRIVAADEQGIKLIQRPSHGDSSTYARNLRTRQEHQLHKDAMMIENKFDDDFLYNTFDDDERRQLLRQNTTLSKLIDHTDMTSYDSGEWGIFMLMFIFVPIMIGVSCALFHMVHFY